MSATKLGRRFAHRVAELLAWLESEGADVTSPNNAGQTPLVVACSLGNPDDDEGELHGAAQLQLCSWLLARGCSVQHADSDGVTPMHWAASPQRLLEWRVCRPRLVMPRLGSLRSDGRP